MGHHRFVDSDSDEEIAVHAAGPDAEKTSKQSLSAKWPRVLIRYDSYLLCCQNNKF